MGSYSGGVFTRSYNWTQDANNNINILPDRMDTEDNGFASGLSLCILKDGTQTLTANIPMSGFKFTGLGGGNTRTDSFNAGQVQDGGLTYGGTSSGTNTIVFSTSPTFTAYAGGQVFRFIPGNTNSGAVTVNINSVGAVAIKKSTPAGLVALVSGDLVAGLIYTIEYDGTQFQLQDPTNISASQLIGTMTNDNAAAGYVGEYIFSNVASGSAVSLSNGSAKTVTSIALTVGDWDVGGNVLFTGGSSTTVAFLYSSISATNNTIDASNDRVSNLAGLSNTLFNGALIPSLLVGPTRISLATPTTYYLIAAAGFSVSTCSAFGIIRARRVR